ncbi:MAG TPA: FUSC family protein, partial [Candidatus Binataceae bacterium]|nr:FUSC family protein [Candidatus Binataceae bacterium]
FGGCVLAFGLIALFDNWLWPDPAEKILPESVAASVARNRRRLLEVARFYLDQDAGKRPPEPPFTSGMPAQLALLERARMEGATAYRRAVMLAAISREERLHIQIDRMTIAAREEMPRTLRMMFEPEVVETISSIAAALEELEREVMVHVRTGPDQPASPAGLRARQALEALDARVVELRPAFINRIGTAEISNFSEFTEALHAMVRLIEKPLDEPPAHTAVVTAAAVTPPAVAGAGKVDPALMRYCGKTGLCIVAAYVIGITSHKAELATILTTVVITALPTYGAALRKMILRIVGAILGGAIALVAIIIVAPNFSTLPSYLIAIFVVLYLSGYASLSSGRVAYAGKQIATTFLLVFADLSPAADVYAPLWRIWGILLGTLVVTVVFFLMWPEYAGNSLLPRLRKVLRDALALAPGGEAAGAVATIEAVNSESMQVLSEILEVAEDARLEGRTSLINHEFVVQAAGTLRRISNRFAGLAEQRTSAPLPPLDAATQAAREATFSALRMRLDSWLAFYESEQCLERSAAMAVAAHHLRSEIANPMEDLSRRISAGGYAQIAAWSLEQRRQILAEMEALRRLEFLMRELDEYLARVPGRRPEPSGALVLREQNP